MRTCRQEPGTMADVRPEVTPEEIRALRETIEALRHALAPHDSHTLGQALDRYTEEHLLPSVMAFNSIEWRRRSIARLEPWRDLQISQEWRQVALDIYRRWPRSTASLTVATLSRVLNLAHQWGWRQKQHDLAGLTRVQAEVQERVLTQDELYLISKAIRRLMRQRIKSAGACLLLILLRGLRLDEAVRLRWEHVAKDCSRINLPRSKVGPIGYDLGPDAQLLVSEQPRSSPFVFPGAEARRPVSRTAVRSMMTEACRLARVEGATIHTLRHTWVTTAIRAGIPIDVVSKSVGHRSTATTLRYLHSCSTEVARACRQIESLLRKRT